MKKKKIVLTRVALMSAVLSLTLSARGQADPPQGEESEQSAPSQASPWSNGQYRPVPDHWRPYLLAPQSRTVRPVKVLQVLSRGGQLQVKVTGTSAAAPGLHASFSESRRYQALQSGDNNGEAAFAPGSDTANIWVGFPAYPYTYDADSHTLPLGSASFPQAIEDPILRGGFRYLTLFLDAPGYVEISGLFGLHRSPGAGGLARLPRLVSMQ